LFALKNLKAVVVEAPLKVQKPIHKERYEMAVKAVLRLFTASPAVKALSAFGTPFLVRITNWLSLLPVNNFRAGGCSEAESLCAENIPAISTAKRAGCFGCPIRCKRRSNDDALPEFETIALVGASCGVFDYDAVRLVNRIANEQGVDTISLGGTLAAFFELCGIKPDGKRLVETVKNLFSGLREFEILKEGAHKMCEIEGAPSVSMCVKGLELPGYDPRGATGMALAYATSNRGACHLRAYMVGPEILRKPRPLSRFSFDGKAGYLRVFQDRFSMCDSLGVCKFAFFAATEEEYAELLSAASGVEYSAEDLMRIGSETYDSERRYNEACGFSKSDDRLPERFFKEKASETVDALKKESFDAALSEYYSIRSW
jgi:aldehyde:ferredoxin oxidoreductase